MAGSYGWNIESTEGFIENEGDYVKMTMPFGTEEDTTQESQNPNPFMRGYNCCCCCCCCPCLEDDQPEPIKPVESHLPDGSGAGYYWCASVGEIPAEAVKAGLDKDGGDIYVGRALHEGELQPAKIVPNHGCAYIAYNGEEIRMDVYEILCRGPATVIWQECEHGAVPPNAVAVGYTADKERLYVGRVFHDGTHTPGKIQPSHGACYIPYGGEELCFPNYEALILQ